MDVDRIAKLRTPAETVVADKRLYVIIVLAAIVGILGGLVSQGFVALIGFITNLSFYGRISGALSAPGDSNLGLWIIVIPVIGGLIVGVMARYGSEAIRGDSIPETMEQVLLNQSRIPPRVTILKPLSAAITIGTGGPFGAEGPIIATGGALGSLVGQLLKTTADERKTLLAAGAAAGLSAIFGAPVSAVLFAIELLLFEFRSRSFIPVAVASVAAAATRIAFEGLKPIFAMPGLVIPSEGAIATYVLIGAAVGLASVGISQSIYWLEAQFERLHHSGLKIHWMWWPAIGSVVVGVIGYFVPRTLGVGYVNISDTLNGSLMTRTILYLAVFKFISWAVALSSGTSGGTLAPLFTIGGALGYVLAVIIHMIFPHIMIDPRMAALVGMAAIFAGASRAMLASIIFAFETTLQSSGLLPLLGGCAAAYLISNSLMRHTIMTEKIARRGLRVPSDFAADHLARILVSDAYSHSPSVLRDDAIIGEVRTWLRSGEEGSQHGGFPVVDEQNQLVGVVSRRDIFAPDRVLDQTIGSLVHRAPAVAFEDNTLREAADLMVMEKVGRLPIVLREEPLKVLGILTRSDLLHAHGSRLEEEHTAHQTIPISSLWRKVA